MSNFACLKKMPWLWACLGGVIITLMGVIFSLDLYRDSANVYTYMARALSVGDLKEAFNPGIPFLNVLLSKIFTVAGVTPLKAMILVSSLFYVGTILGVYRLLREFVPNSWAGIGAAMFAFAPKIIRFYCTGLIDSSKCFFLIWALYFLILLIKNDFRFHRHSWGFFGMAGGLALARSEGIGNGVTLVLCALVYWIISAIKGNGLKKLLVLISGVPLAAGLLFSKVAVNGVFCNQWIFDYRLSKGFHKIYLLISSFFNSGITATASNGVDVSKVNKITWGLLFNQSFRGTYELYAVLMILGVLLIISAKAPKLSFLWRDKKVPNYLQWHKCYWIFPICVVTNAIIFKVSGMVAYRYFLINIPLLLIFALIVLIWAWEWSKKWRCHYLVIFAGVVISILQVVNGSEKFFDKKSRNEYYSGIEVGKLLSKEKATARIWFMDSSVEWYHSGLKRAVPVEVRVKDFTGFMDFDYFLGKKRGDEVDKLAERKDLQELPLPEFCSVRLFKRVNL